MAAYRLFTILILLIGTFFFHSDEPSSIGKRWLAQGNFPTSRVPVEWPFRWDSIWNMPIGDGAIYVPAGIQPATEYGVFADEDILILEPEAPLVDVIAHDAGWDPNRTRCGSILSPAQVLMSGAPVPLSFSTDPGPDGEDTDGTPNQSAAILMPDGETIRQTQPLHRCGQGGAVVSQYTFPDDNIRTGNGIPGAHGGSSMSSMGGTIRMGELVPGQTIRHALKLVIDSAQYTAYNDDGTPGYRWPATSADFGAENDYGGQNRELEMGALLALKPDFDLEALRTEPAKIVARALIDYGGYVVDSTGWDANYFATEWGPNGRVLDEFEDVWGFPLLSPQISTCSNLNDPSCRWSKDMADLFTNLHVITNNSPESIGGPGQRRQPCAPPFADGSGMDGSSAAPGYCARSGVQPSGPISTPTPSATQPPTPTLTPVPNPTVTPMHTPSADPVVCQGNLLRNPSFESGLNDLNDLGGAAPSTDARGGATAAQTGPERGGISQNIAVSAGEAFTLSGWAKVNGAADWSGVGIAFYDPQWNRLSDFSVDVTSTDYSEHTVTGTAPNNSAHLDVWAFTNGGQTLFVDDFCLTAVTAISQPDSNRILLPLISN